MKHKSVLRTIFYISAGAATIQFCDQVANDKGTIGTTYFELPLVGKLESAAIVEMFEHFP